MARATSKGRLIALDGVNGMSLRLAARKIAVDNRPRGAVSYWGASGIFDELALSGPETGEPSVRTLLLLYAADLAFRLRWQINPALAEGRLLIVAPYVDTAIALGRAVGIEQRWLRDLFAFAPKPSERHHVAGASKTGEAGDSLVEYACRYVGRFSSPRRLLDQTNSLLAGKRSLKA